MAECIAVHWTVLWQKGCSRENCIAIQFTVLSLGKGDKQGCIAIQPLHLRHGTGLGTQGAQQARGHGVGARRGAGGHWACWRWVRAGRAGGKHGRARGAAWHGRAERWRARESGRARQGVAGVLQGAAGVRGLGARADYGLCTRCNRPVFDPI